MTDLKIYSVTLVFSPPGPVHASLVIAGDEATASAIATHHVMTNEPLVTAPLVTVMALPIDTDMLRGMLRTIEGKGPGDVVTLVPKGPSAATMFAEQRAAEILRKHEPALDAADASTFCGSRVTEAWEQYRAEHPDVYIGHRARENRQPPLHYWGEEYGPPMPEAS